jgi:hypothetical protein
MEPDLFFAGLFPPAEYGCDVCNPAGRPSENPSGRLPATEFPDGLNFQL